MQKVNKAFFFMLGRLKYKMSEKKIDIYCSKMFTTKIGS